MLAATLVLYAIQASYSEDVSNAIENIGFFLVPFAVLFCLLAEVEWSRALLRRALIAVAVVAVGLRAGRDLPVLRPRPVPQPGALRRQRAARLLPRQLDLLRPQHLRPLPGAGADGARGLHRLGRRPPPSSSLATAVFALGLVALAFSYSLTSFAALLAGLGIVAVLRWQLARRGGVRGLRRWSGWRAGDRRRHADLDIETDRSIDSGHADLVRGGLVLFGAWSRRSRARDRAAGEPEDVGRPIAGYGSGSFGRAFFEHIEPARTTVSHSEPITVAAEQGVIGLRVYGALLVDLAGDCCSARAPGPRSRARSVAACFVAILIDSFGYTGFTIDPATWALLGLGVALRRDPPEASATINT